jgi:hypothetical protein
VARPLRQGRTLARLVTGAVRVWLASVVVAALAAAVAVAVVAWHPWQAGVGRVTSCPWPDCGSRGPERERYEALLEAARTASVRGRMWFGDAPDWNQDEVWLATHLLCRRPDGWLRARTLVERARLKMVGPSARLMDPRQVGAEVSYEHLQRRQDLRSYVAASTGDPESLALEMLRRFLGVNEDGHLLTHQLLVLVWWEDVGRELPPDLASRRPELMERVRREQEADPRFSDLYAERAIVLAWFGSAPCPPDLPRWAATVIEAQDSSGGWYDPHDEDGHARDGDHEHEHGGERKPPSHTTVVSLAVVEAFLDCMEPHPEARKAFAPWRGMCGEEGAAVAH